MAHVYISYFHTESNHAYTAHAQVAAAGFTPWANSIPTAGAGWFSWADEALRDAFSMIVVVSSAALTPYVTYEWAYALGARLPVIPLVVGEGVELPPALAACDPVPFPGEDSWAAVIDRVRDAARPFSARFPLDTSETIQRLERRTDSFEAADRAAALDQLAESDEPDARAALRRALAHPLFADMRRAAAGALARLHDTASVPHLCAALDEDDISVFLAVVGALTQIGAPAIPALAETVTGGNRLQRRGAVLALCRIMDGDPVPGLIAALDIRDWHVPRTAAIALGRIGDPRAIPALTAAQASDDPHLRDLASAALERMPQ